MVANDEIAGALRAMLMPARWNGLRRGETKRVIGALVYPKIFKISPKWYLTKIIELMGLDVDLTSFLIDKHPSETDNEIRCFLSDLAVEIEKTFPNVARSGQCVTIPGYWVGGDDRECSNYFEEGDTLPCINNRFIIWERKNNVAESPEQALLQEFSTYYSHRTIGERILYKRPEEFAAYSSLRLIDKEVNPFKTGVENLLIAMSKDQLHPLTKKIEEITKQNWTEDEESWEWYQNLLRTMQQAMAASLA